MTPSNIYPVAKSDIEGKGKIRQNALSKALRSELTDGRRADSVKGKGTFKFPRTMTDLTAAAIAIAAILLHA